MNKLILTLFFFLGVALPLCTADASDTFYGLDYNAYLAGRNKPFGTSLNGQVGYDFLLWGDNENHSFKYGYLRPDLTLSTSMYDSEADLHMAIFPLSIIGIGAGVTESSRQTTSDTADCNDNECQGILKSQYIDAQLLLGYGPLFFKGVARWSTFSPDQSTEPFVEENVVLAGATGGDTLFYRSEVLGYTINENTSVGVYFSQANMTIQQTFNSAMNVFVRHGWGSIVGSIGAGSYMSSTQTSAATFFGVVQWTGVPSLSYQ